MDPILRYQIIILPFQITTIIFCVLNKKLSKTSKTIYIISILCLGIIGCIIYLFRFDNGRKRKQLYEDRKKERN